MSERWRETYDQWKLQSPNEFQPYDVECARCGKVLSCEDAYVEEGDEWECPECFERCEAQERAGMGKEVKP